MYNEGDRVNITRGKYAKYGSGTFVAYSGMISAQVKIDRLDEVHTIRLKSIKLKPCKDKKMGTERDQVTVERDDFEALLKAIYDLQIRAEALEDKYKSIN